MKRGLFVLVLAALAGLALGQGAMVRVAHLSPDAPAVDGSGPSRAWPSRR